MVRIGLLQVENTGMGQEVKEPSLRPLAYQRQQDLDPVRIHSIPCSSSFNDHPLFVRNGVQLVNQIVDFGVRGGDFALDTVKLRGAGSPQWPFFKCTVRRPGSCRLG